MNKSSYSKIFLYESLWSFSIILYLGYFKLQYAMVKKDLFNDGYFYTDVATHVRDGQGLSTHISLYHQAFTYFPHESSISPTWPLLYGYVSRFFDIHTVAIWLPTFFYFVALLTGYLWANRLFPSFILPTPFPGFKPAHLFMLMLGTHMEFFVFTSIPYTEAIAYSMLGAALWRLHKIIGDPDLKRGLEIGGWISILYFTRNQFALVAIAVYITLAWSVISNPQSRNRKFAFIGTLLSSFFLVGGYYFFYLRNFVHQPALVALLRFDLGKESSLLSVFDTFVKTNGIVEYLTDRASGFPVAFSLTNEFAYIKSFYTFQYAFLAAIPLLIYFALKYRRQWRKAWNWLKHQESLPWIMIVLFALGAFFSMHLIHFEYFAKWHFARRHATIVVFLFFLSMVLILKNKYLARVGLFIIGTSFLMGAITLSQIPHSVESEKHPSEYFVELGDWLNNQGKIRVAINDPYPLYLSFQTSAVGYHWYFKKTTFEDIDMMVTRLNVDYVIKFPDTHSYDALKDKRFNESFVLIKQLSGAKIYKAKPD